MRFYGTLSNQLVLWGFGIISLNQGVAAATITNDMCGGRVEKTKVGIRFQCFTLFAKDGLSMLKFPSMFPSPSLYYLP